jgi:hypothetical protein
MARLETSDNVILLVSIATECLFAYALSSVMGWTGAGKSTVRLETLSLTCY